MDQEYQNILVPVDGSQESEFALHRAIAIAKRNGAPYRYFKCNRYTSNGL